jgi:hypothetical protein
VVLLKNPCCLTAKDCMYWRLVSARSANALYCDGLLEVAPESGRINNPVDCKFTRMLLWGEPWVEVPGLETWAP